jgi:hypothetical protein
LANVSVTTRALAADAPRHRPTHRRLAVIAVVAACFGLAALSLLVPYPMFSDVWAWLVWGREVRHLALDTTHGPSWKPLAVLLTSVLSLFGNSAPDLLLLVVRAAWLLAAVLAFRIGKGVAGTTAGVLAAAGLALIPSAAAGWLGYVLQGSCEPLVAALVLGAIDRHLAGRRTQALALACLAALGRPEVWPLAVVYGLAVWWVERRRGAVIVALLGAVPAIWLGGSYWGSGNPFGAAHRAHAVLEGRLASEGETRSPAGEAVGTLEKAAQLVILPYAIAALFAVGQAVLRVRRDGDRCDRVTVALGAGVVGWIAIVMGGALIGLPAAVPHFMLAPAAVLSVLGGVGLVGVVRSFPQGGARLAAAGVLGVAALGFALPRLGALAQQAPRPGNRDERQALITVLQRSDAKTRLGRCGGEVVFMKASGGQVSYRLGVSLAAVRQWKPGKPKIRRGILIARQGESAWDPKQLAGMVARRRPVRRVATADKFSVFEVGCPPND